MTLDEAYDAFGLEDPTKHGRRWAEFIWGVDGIPPAEATGLILAMSPSIRGKMENARVFPADYIEHHLNAFTISAKARIYDLETAPKLEGHA